MSKQVDQCAELLRLFASLSKIERCEVMDDLQERVSGVLHAQDSAPAAKDWGTLIRNFGTGIRDLFIGACFLWVLVYATFALTHWLGWTGPLF